MSPRESGVNGVPSATARAVRHRLHAVGHRLARGRTLTCAVDALATASAATLGLLAIGHAIPAVAGAIAPAAVIVAVAGAAWVGVASGRGPDLARLAAWQCDRALGLPQHMLAALEVVSRDAPNPGAPSRDAPNPGAPNAFAAAIATVAASHLARVSDRALAPISAGPRASLAAAAALACACALVAGGWPAGDGDREPGATAARAVADLETAAGALARTAAGAESGPGLVHAARGRAAGDAGPAQGELARLGADRARARAAGEAARALAQDPALARVQRAIALGDAPATAEATAALETALAGTSAGDGGRASASRALEEAARAVGDLSLERPLLRLAALAERGATDGAVLAQALAELARRARAEGELALAQATVERALAPLGTGMPSTLRVEPSPPTAAMAGSDDGTGASGGTSGAAAGLAPIASPTPEDIALAPPSTTVTAASPGRTPRPIRLTDRAVVDAYLHGRFPR